LPGRMVLSQLKDMDKGNNKKSQRYIGDAVLGGTDGIITTFAVVSGVEGASLASEVVIILGTANLIADAFSMGAGNFLGVLSSRYYRQSQYQRISELVRNNPIDMKNRLRGIYSSLGFKGDTLQQVVEKISSSHKNWVKALLHEELLSDDGKSPLSAGGVTFFSFLLFGMLPLLFYFFNFFYPNLYAGHSFIATIFASASALLLLGAIRAWVTRSSMLGGALQVLAVGGIAGTIAYGVGYGLKVLI